MAWIGDRVINEAVQASGGELLVVAWNRKALANACSAELVHTSPSNYGFGTITRGVAALLRKRGCAQNIVVGG